MSDQTYDKEFKQLKELKKKLNWLPWVGKNYIGLQPENRILLVGESHYLKTKPCDDVYYVKASATRDIIDQYGINEHKTKFHINTQELMAGRPLWKKEARTAFWNNVAFYNFIQSPMEQLGYRPNNKHIADAGENFIDLLKILKPTVCIFLGLEAAEKLGGAFENSDYRFEKPIGKTKMVKRNCPRIGKVINADGQMIKLLFVKHPGSYFSPGSWNLFLAKNAPSQMKWFKSLVNINKAA
jgi:hypothetical protein